MSDLEQEPISKVYLSSFARGKHADQIITFAPFDNNQTFIIDEPYTGKYELSRRYDMKYEELSNGLSDDIADNTIIVDTTFTTWDIPPVKHLTKDKRVNMKLMKLLWIPYSRMIEDKLREQQIEFYFCHEQNISYGYLLMPLRMPKEEWNPYDYNPFYRLNEFSWPTFSLHKATYDILKRTLSIINGIHFFWFYGRRYVQGINDTSVRKEPLPITAIQFTS